MAWVSAKLTPARTTSTTTSPSPASGPGTSASLATSGPPNSSMTIALTGKSLSGHHLLAELREDRGLVALALHVVGDHMGDGVDERQVGECLGQVAEMRSDLDIELLRIEAERPCNRQELPAKLARVVAGSYLRHRRRH